MSAPVLRSPTDSEARKLAAEAYAAAFYGGRCAAEIIDSVVAFLGRLEPQDQSTADQINVACAALRLAADKARDWRRAG